MPNSETAQQGGDDLRSQIAAAMETPTPQAEDTAAPGSDDGEAPEITAPADKTAEEPKAEGDGRDEKGRFKKKDEAPAEQSAKAAEGAKQPEAAAKDAEKDGEKIAPPAGWSGHSKVRWDGLPKTVQQQIAKDYQELNGLRQGFSELSQVLEPRKGMLEANYGSLGKGVDHLFKISDFAEKKPEQFIEWFAQQRGIDLTRYAPKTQQDGSQEQAVPALQAAVKKIASLEQTVNSLQSGFQTNQNTHLQSQIDAFANDPSHPYFNDVRKTMSVFLQTGQAKDMQEAYDKACWADPAIRAALQQEMDDRRVSEIKAKAEKAAKAAGSISGSPTGNTVTEQPSSTLREELQRNMKGAAARV